MICTFINANRTKCHNLKEEIIKATGGNKVKCQQHWPACLYPSNLLLLPPASLQQGWSISNDISHRSKASVSACGIQPRQLAWLQNLGQKKKKLVHATLRGGGASLPFPCPLPHPLIPGHCGISDFWGFAATPPLPSLLPSFLPRSCTCQLHHTRMWLSGSVREAVLLFYFFFHLFHFPPSFCFFFFFFLSRLPVCHGSAPLLSLHILLLLSSLPLLSSPPIILRVKLICVAAEAGVGGWQGGGRDVESIIDF